MSVQLTIHELAKIVNIPSSTIRYYCNSGIISPSGILDNGYRYFHIDKIEELRFISYMTYLDIPLKDIKGYLDRRDVASYEQLLVEQHHAIQEKIDKLSMISNRLDARLKYLQHIKELPTLGQIIIEEHPHRPALVIDIDTITEIDFEKALLNFEAKTQLPSSLIVGDQGFIVDLSKLTSRQPYEFIGMYMTGDYEKNNYRELYHIFPEGKWLTIYYEGGHKDAKASYVKLIDFARKNGLELDNYAMERVVIDHFIAREKEMAITEIQIRILENRN